MKPKFIELHYNDVITYTPKNNSVYVLPLMAHILIDREDFHQKQIKVRGKAREVYKKVNTGQLFRPIGNNSNSDVIARITRINHKTLTLSWLQHNSEEYQKSYHMDKFKPAKGKWPINAFIQLVINKQIELL